MFLDSSAKRCIQGTVVHTLGYSGAGVGQPSHPDDVTKRLVDPARLDVPETRRVGTTADWRGGGRRKEEGGAPTGDS